MNTNAPCCTGLDARRRAKPLAQKWSDLPEDLKLRKGAYALLSQFPQARSLLAEACEKLREFFGSSAQIELDRFDDPEAETESPSLYLIVVTNLKALPARQALDRFEDEWWIDNADRGGGHLHISLEFL